MSEFDAAPAIACPGCGPGFALGPPAGPLRAWSCAACGGRLLGAGAETERAMAEARPARGEALGVCPSCEARLEVHQLGGRPVGRCHGCDLWWIPGASASTDARPHRAGARVALLAGALVLATALGAWWALGAVRGRALPRVPPAVPPAEARAEPVAPAPAAPPASAPRTEQPGAVAASAPRTPIPPERLFAGRSADWWERRLTLLSARADDEGRRLHEATRRRAEALGLVVTEAGGSSRVEASEELARALREERTADEPSRRSAGTDRGAASTSSTGTTP